MWVRVAAPRLDLGPFLPLNLAPVFHKNDDKKQTKYYDVTEYWDLLYFLFQCSVTVDFLFLLLFSWHLSHCVPCNAFGEQREIYEWIRLFREVLFLCQGGAYFWSGGRSFHFRRALFGPWEKHSKIQGGLSPSEQKMHSKTLGRPQGKRSIDKIMKDTSFIVIETTVLLSKNWQCYHLSIRGRLHHKE